MKTPVECLPIKKKKEKLGLDNTILYLCILSICLNSQQDIYSKTPIDHSKSNDKKVFHIKK